MTRSIVAVVAMLLLLLGAIPAQAQADQRCFPETNFCISGRIREFWNQNGGLLVFGYPIGPQQEQMIEGKSLQVQQFERNRLELHPENQRPYDVLLGRLGADRLNQQGRDWFAFPKSGQQPSCQFFPQTNQNVCGDILAAWRVNGLELDGRTGKSEAENLALFGLPLSGLMTESLGDGKQYQVQWFERARFELHPENAAPFNVLLGLLGNEMRDATAAPPAAEPVSTVPPPPPIQSDDVLNQYRHKMPKGLWQVNKNGISIAATGFEYQDSIGRYYKAGDHFKYVVFAIEVANTGYNSGSNDTFYANPTSFDLIDLDGQTHEIDSALFSLDNYFKGGTFYQGTHSSGLLVYQIAENSAPAILVLGHYDRVELDLRVAPIQ
jgi:hypothetical protein